MQALVARHVIPIGGAEWTRPVMVYMQGGTEQSNRPFQIGCSRFRLDHRPVPKRERSADFLPRVETISTLTE